MSCCPLASADVLLYTIYLHSTFVLIGSENQLCIRKRGPMHTAAPMCGILPIFLTLDISHRIFYFVCYILYELCIYIIVHAFLCIFCLLCFNRFNKWTMNSTHLASRYISHSASTCIFNSLRITVARVHGWQLHLHSDGGSLLALTREVRKGRYLAIQTQTSGTNVCWK